MDAAVRSELEIAVGHVEPQKAYLEPGTEPAGLKAAVPKDAVWLEGRWTWDLGTERTDFQEMCPEMPVATGCRAVFGEDLYTITAKGFCI